MKAISFWASKHIFIARTWLIGFKILFTISAVFLGSLLKAYDWLLQFYIVMFFLLMVLAGVYLFIEFSSAIHKKYWKRVIVTISLSLCAAISFVHIAADRNFFSTYNKLLAARTFESANIVPVNTRIFSDPPAQIKNKKAFKKQNRTALKKYKAEPSPKNKERVGIVLILLTAIVLSGALVGVGVLSCNLACSGYEAAGVLVGFLGQGLVIVLMVFLFKKINKKYFPSKKKKTETLSPEEK